MVLIMVCQLLIARPWRALFLGPCHRGLPRTRNATLAHLVNGRHRETLQAPHTAIVPEGRISRDNSPGGGGVHTAHSVSALCHRQCPGVDSAEMTHYSAVQVLGDDTLKLIARELVTTVKNSIS